MPAPPSCAGAAQRTVACASPADADADAGASGLVTTTVNHGPMSPIALANDEPVVVTALLFPVTVRLVTRPPHCSPVAWPFWSVPDKDSRELMVRLVKVPMDEYAAWICPAGIESVHGWLFHGPGRPPSHASGRGGGGG